MGNVPVLKPHEVASRLTALGFVEVRQKGSHKQYRQVHHRTISSGKGHLPDLVRQIVKDVGLTIDQFLHAE